MTRRNPYSTMARRSLRLAVMISLISSALTVGGASTGASVEVMPSDSGKIAFTENTRAGGFDIFTVGPDGTGRRRLTFNNDSYTAAYGPEGQRIAYTKCGGKRASCSVWLMKADGTNKRELIPGPSSDPAWSPDGTEIVFVGGSDERSRQLHIYSLASGTTRQLTSGTAGPGPRSSQPTWAPRGRRIAFIQVQWDEDVDGNLVPSDNGGLFVVRADGTNLKQVAAPGRLAKQMPDWSPTGGRIAYARVLPGGERTPSEPKGISTIRPDGTDVKRLSRKTDVDPTWSPSGTRIAFSRLATDAPGDEHPGLWAMSRRGDRLTQIYPNFYVRESDWQPRP